MFKTDGEVLELNKSLSIRAESVFSLSRFLSENISHVESLADVKNNSSIMSCDLAKYSLTNLKIEGSIVAMIQVHDIIFCLNSSNVGGQGVSAFTVLSAVNPEYIPGLFSFSTIITIIGIDTSKEHALKLLFTSDDEIVGAIEGPLPPIDDLSNLPSEYKGINLSVDWNNVNLKREGNYTLSVYLDDKKLKDKSIYIKGKNQ